MNDSVTREAISRVEERKLLRFVKDDPHFSKYYEGIYILFKTGLRISEFCGLTVSDIDFKEHTINIDHQLQKKSKNRILHSRNEDNQRNKKDTYDCGCGRMFSEDYRKTKSTKSRTYDRWKKADFYTLIKMEVYVIPYTGSITLNISFRSIIEFTRFRCQMLHRMYADTLIVPIWRSRE